MPVEYDQEYGETYGITETRADEAHEYKEAVDDLLNQVMRLTYSTLAKLHHDQVRHVADATIEIRSLMTERVFPRYLENDSLLEAYESPEDIDHRNMLLNGSWR